MGQALDSLAGKLAAAKARVASLRATGSVAMAMERWRADCQAMLFHLRNRHDHPALVGVLGGTGTGKSTLVNRLLGAEISATSLRRTFTSGAIAITCDVNAVPEGWLALPRAPSDAQPFPIRGAAGMLTVVQVNNPLLAAATLVDTADVDGDQPVHHAEADRVFRWAEAVLFVVTPEKYQMTELLPYYRLARRYGIPSLFIMNKCEEAAVLEDYRRQLGQRDWPEARVFAVARDDAGYEPPRDANLESLAQQIGGLRDVLRRSDRTAGLRQRRTDLVGRLHDQILMPLREQRREVDRLCMGLRAITAPPPGVDVSPVTQQLQRKLQEQSVLYLIGPQRMLDRVRQVPGMIARLPRNAWDLLVGGRRSADVPDVGPQAAGTLPDFARLAADQFTILQSRIDDLLRGSSFAASVMQQADGYRQIRTDASAASAIVDEELASLKAWLEERWHAAPRDTRIVQKLLAALPGGKHLTRWSEAAPYLLTIVVATHHAFFGPIDLLILGSYSLATWLGERLSNEVTSRTRQANRRIAERFARLAAEQVEKVCAWLDRQTPGTAELERLAHVAESLSAGREDD